MDSNVVIAGLGPAVHALAAARKTWMRGTRPRMTWINTNETSSEHGFPAWLASGRAFAPAVRSVHRRVAPRHRRLRHHGDHGPGIRQACRRKRKPGQIRHARPGRGWRQDLGAPEEPVLRSQLERQTGGNSAP